MRAVISFVTAAIASTLATNASALNVGETVDNFRLLDHRGGASELYYLSDMKAVVVMAQANQCELATKSIPRLNEIRDQYQSRGVRVFMLNSALNEDRPSIVAAMDKAGSTIPVLEDPLQLIGESFDATHAGEVLVINPVDRKSVV